MSKSCTCSSCLGGPLVLANSVWSYLLCFMFLASRGYKQAFVAPEVAGLDPDRSMQLFTIVGLTCARGLLVCMPAEAHGWLHGQIFL